MSVVIRPATRADVPAMVALVHELAAYERAPEECLLTEDQLTGVLFGADPAVWAHVAESDGVVEGVAIWYLSFSTWTGTHGIWLEDFVVREHLRGTGIGTRLIGRLAALCVERGYVRLEWNVLDWNEPSIGYYRSIGGEHLDDWQTFRLSGEPLAELATR